MDSTILQYEISDWSQLSKCQSNNSPDLKIVVSKFVQNRDIQGTLIKIVHPMYGTLFAYTILPKGKLISKVDSDPSEVMNHTILLNELKRYGFYVYYEEERYLSKTIVSLLRTVQGLHFDKLRLLSVCDLKTGDTTTYVVAFNVKDNPDWINPGYSPSYKEYTEATANGSCYNLTLAKNVEGLHIDWSWLYNYIADIDQILRRYEE